MSITPPKLPRATPKAEDDEIDLLALLGVLLRGWKIILTLALLGLLLGILYSRYVNPTYRADALLQLDEKSLGLSALGANISELVAPEISLAETERELIKSRMVLEPVVDLLHLDIQLTNPQQNALDRLLQAQTATPIHSSESVTLDTADGQAQINTFEVPQDYLNHSFILQATVGGFVLSDGVYNYPGQIGKTTTFKTTAGNIVIKVMALPTDEHTILLTKQSLQSSTDALKNALSVSERGKQTGIIELSLTGNNQEQVTRVLTQIVRSYVNQNQERGSEQTTTTIQFMESQIPKLRQELAAAEATFNEFRKTYGTIDVSKEAELLLTESYQIESQLNQLNLKLAELSTYYTDEHPLVIQIKDQLKVLRIRRQEVKGLIARLPEIQREFLQLSEDMEINREIYLTMLKNHEQLKIVKAGEIGYVRVVDMPISTFRPIAPKKLQIWTLALLLGTMMGTLLVLARNLLRNTVKGPEQLEAKTGIPVIATIPRSKSLQRLANNKRGAHRLLAQVDHDGLSYEAIKSLRTFLMFGMPAVYKLADKGKVILITGESPGVGKSFITANLAEVFAQLDKKVLVLDGDMRLGHLHNIFTLSPDRQYKGLTEYLSLSLAKNQNQDSSVSALYGSSATETLQGLTEFIHPTSLKNIDLMPRGHHAYNPTSLLASDCFSNLMAQLVQSYDYIFIDSPPVLVASDALITAQHADKVLMVTRYNQSIEGQLAYGIKQLHKANIEVDGIVLNDMRQGIIDKYSYHYSYTYAQGTAR